LRVLFQPLMFLTLYKSLPLWPAELYSVWLLNTGIALFYCFLNTFWWFKLVKRALSGTPKTKKDK
jgi:hypothetical protein